MMKTKCSLTLLSVLFLLVGCGEGASSEASASSSEETKPVDAVYKEKIAKAPKSYSGTNLSTFVDGSLFYSMGKLSSTENTIVSPLTLGLNYSAISLVSSSADAVKTKLGISSLAEFSALNETFNWDNDSEFDNRRDLMRSLTFHQIGQDGNSLSYLPGIRKTLSDNGIATLVSTYSNKEKDAASFIKAELGKEIDVPQLALDNPCVLTYSAMRVKESRSGAVTASKTFHNLSGTTSEVKGDIAVREGTYWTGEGYSAFRYNVNETRLTIVLPDEGTSLSSVDATAAFLAGENGTDARVTDAFFPYFSLKDEIDYSTEFGSLFANTGIYSGLVSDASGLIQFGSKQVNDFTFGEKGIEGTSLTVSGAAGSAEPQELPEHSFVVDRPFYCFLSYLGVPLFAMTVVNL